MSIMENFREEVLSKENTEFWGCECKHAKSREFGGIPPNILPQYYN